MTDVKKILEQFKAFFEKYLPEEDEPDKFGSQVPAKLNDVLASIDFSKDGYFQLYVDIKDGDVTAGMLDRAEFFTKEEYTDDAKEIKTKIENLSSEKEALVLEKETLVQEKEALVAEKEALTQEKVTLAQEKDELVVELAKKPGKQGLQHGVPAAEEEKQLSKAEIMAAALAEKRKKNN